MVLAHSFVGVPLTFYLLKHLEKNSEKNSSYFYQNLIYFFGIIGSVFPDFDLTLTFFIHDLNHRKLISHSILPYLLIFCLVHLFSRFFKDYQSKIKLINLVFFVGVSSHLLIDFLVGGISLFSPLSKQVYGLPIYFESLNNDFFYNYFTSWYSFFEFLIIIYSLIMILNLKKILVVRILPFILFFVALGMVFLTK